MPTKSQLKQLIKRAQPNVPTYKLNHEELTRMYDASCHGALEIPKQLPLAQRRIYKKKSENQKNSAPPALPPPLVAPPLPTTPYPKTQIIIDRIHASWFGVSFSDRISKSNVKQFSLDMAYLDRYLLLDFGYAKEDIDMTETFSFAPKFVPSYLVSLRGGGRTQELLDDWESDCFYTSEVVQALREKNYPTLFPPEPEMTDSEDEYLW